MRQLHSLKFTEQGWTKSVAAGAWPALKTAGKLPGDYVSPAAALWIGAHMWAWLSPHTYHLMQCLAASVPLMAGYAQTKRAAALGHIAAGQKNCHLCMNSNLPFSTLLSAPTPASSLGDFILHGGISDAVASCQHASHGWLRSNQEGCCSWPHCCRSA